jgi:speckle-type POZ protein
MANKSLVFKAFFQRFSKYDSDNTYNIEDFEPEIVKQMIHFIYTNKLAEDTQPSEALLRIGDKYDVNGLVALCTVELAESINVDNAIRDQYYKTFILYEC